MAVPALRQLPTPMHDPQPQLSTTWRRRVRASLLHLMLSSALALLVGWVVFGLWYPAAYRSFSGGTELFLLVVGVDLALGPLITLVIFDKRKPRGELLQDMALIVALQLVALGYGLHTVAQSRPVVLALEVDRFRVVAAADVYAPELPPSLTGIGTLPLTGPVVVSSVLPSDPVGRSEALSLALKGHDIGTRPSLWRPWSAAVQQDALVHAKPLAALPGIDLADQQSILTSTLSRLNRSSNSLVFIPMVTFRGDWIALLGAKDGELLGFAPLNGF